MQKTPRLSAKQRAALDELARLFTVQEERCRSGLDVHGARTLDREPSRISRASLSPSQIADASFIYQHVNFQVCVC